MTKDLVYIVDDNPDMAEVAEMTFSSLGFSTKVQTKSREALQEILQYKPKLIVLDKMMPDIDGIELCKLIRNESKLSESKVIMLSSKSYEYDKKQAFDVGVDEYITKPITVEKVETMFESLQKMELKFWGVRGTLPVPGEDSLEYGGNTNCVTLELPGNNLFILDAGSGIKKLANHVMKSQQGKPFSANLLITHHHWDHINAIPFFTPLYIPKNEIGVWGPHQGEYSMKKILSDQMDGVYFPVTIHEFSANVQYHDLDAGKYTINNIPVETMYLNHPGVALAYKIKHNGKSFVYMTDNEIYPEDSEFFDVQVRNEMLNFCSDADILCHDTTYTDEEYKAKIQWGHSSVSEVTRLAHEAKVKQLFLIHHDPDQNDKAIDEKHLAANHLLDQLQSSTVCHTPREDETVKI